MTGRKERLEGEEEEEEDDDDDDETQTNCLFERKSLSKAFNRRFGSRKQLFIWIDVSERC